MEKKIEDYLHLYLGCEIMHCGGTIFKLTGNRYAAYVHGDLPIENIKPLLRPLSDITEEEMLEVAQMTGCLPYAWFERGSYEVKKLDHPNEGLEVCVSGKYGFRITNNKAIYFYDYSQPNTAMYVSETFEIIRYLLSKHFDLFGLIDAGLAIDKTTLNR